MEGPTEETGRKVDLDGEIIDLDKVPRRESKYPIPERVAEAVKRIPNAPISIRGIFRHPDTFTEQEDEIIAAGLRAHIPLHILCTKVNCERNCLSRHIKATPELAQLAIDARQGFVDQAEYQMDRLVTSGNPAAIMFVLERLGRDRGWSADSHTEDKEDVQRIQFGEIPDEEIKESDSILDGIRKQNGMGVLGSSKVFESDPMRQAMAAEMGEIPEGEMPENGKPTNVDAVTASPPPYDTTDESNPGHEEGTPPGFIEDNFNDADPFAGGEDSPFGGF